MKSNLTAGQLFKEARLKKGLTQLQVATKSDIHPNTYAKIERDEQEASFPTIKKLAKVLDLEIKNIPD
jgi:transcriptional regulator with XRE-family HTH domain